MKHATQNGTDGRVYGGDCDLIHIADGKRAEMGAELGRELDAMMRTAAVWSGARTGSQAYGESAQPLCPGCYMVALFNAAVSLADANGQSVHELGASMSRAFWELATGGDKSIESITVELDSRPDFRP